MDKPNLFLITLSNLEGTYYAGQEVRGHCTVELNQPTSLSNVHMQFKGEASVSWSESIEKGHGDDKTTEEVDRSAKESYFDHTLYLMGSENDPLVDEEEHLTLSAGRHFFSFSFPLPLNLPSSFDSKHGKVAYTIKAVVRRPSKFDFRTEKEVAVIGLLDLNMDPEAELPSEEKEDEKMMCCLWCKSGPVVARIRLLRKGHILGEPLQFRATINNNSSLTVDACILVLEQMTTYHAEEHTKTSSKSICQIEPDDIEQGTSVRWTGSPEPLVIPHHLPPSKLPGCNIMDVDYSVSLTVSSSCTLPMTLTVPLTIGTLPSRYAVTGDPPEPCRPLQMTPLDGYPTVPVPGFEDGFLEDHQQTVPSAPVLESKEELSYGEAEGASAPFLSSADARPPVCVKKYGALDFHQDIGGQPPPSYEEYTKYAVESNVTQGGASCYAADVNRV